MSSEYTTNKILQIPPSREHYAGQEGLLSQQKDIHGFGLVDIPVSLYKITTDDNITDPFHHDLSPYLPNQCLLLARGSWSTQRPKCLRKPAYLGFRDDKEPHDCTAPTHP